MRSLFARGSPVILSLLVLMLAALMPTATPNVVPDDPVPIVAPMADGFDVPAVSGADVLRLVSLELEHAAIARTAPTATEAARTVTRQPAPDFTFAPAPRAHLRL